eukprot:COSAG05_NODE_48_length_24425_cov_90.438543_17_plen_103_part_00
MRCVFLESLSLNLDRGAMCVRAGPYVPAGIGLRSGLHEHRGATCTREVRRASERARSVAPQHGMYKVLLKYRTRLRLVEKEIEIDDTMFAMLAMPIANPALQ